MLTLEELQVAAKEANVTLSKGRGYSWTLEERKPFDTKAYEKWKKRTLAAWAAYDAREIAYRKKYAYVSVYTPIVGGPRCTETSLRKEYDYQFVSKAGLELGEGSSTFSCAIAEFGNFLSKAKLNKYWDLLLSYYVATTKYHYLKCATPVTKTYKPIRDALKRVGFEMRAKETSNHGKYFVEVWEYIKPRKKETKKRKERNE